MSHKIKIEDCRDGRTFGQLAQARGADVKKVGSYLEITTARGTVHVADCDRAMPKPEREYIYSLFCKLGLGIVVLGMVIGGLILAA